MSSQMGAVPTRQWENADERRAMEEKVLSFVRRWEDTDKADTFAVEEYVRELTDAYMQTSQLVLRSRAVARVKDTVISRHRDQISELGALLESASTPTPWWRRLFKR